jgi:hypothetical protein
MVAVALVAEVTLCLKKRSITAAAKTRYLPPERRPDVVNYPAS